MDGPGAGHMIGYGVQELDALKTELKAVEEELESRRCKGRRRKLEVLAQATSSGQACFVCMCARTVSCVVRWETCGPVA